MYKSLSLALWSFEALKSNMSTQSVSRGFPRCLRVRSFVVYGVSKLRRFKNRNEDTETKVIFLLTLDISRRRHRAPEHFNSNKNQCTVILSVSTLEGRRFAFPNMIVIMMFRLSDVVNYELSSGETFSG